MDGSEAEEGPQLALAAGGANASAAARRGDSVGLGGEDDRGRLRGRQDTRGRDRAGIGGAAGVPDRVIVGVDGGQLEESVRALHHEGCRLLGEDEEGRVPAGRSGLRNNLRNFLLEDVGLGGFMGGRGDGEHCAFRKFFFFLLWNSMRGNGV